MRSVTFTINAAAIELEVEPRMLLCDVLRDHAGLTSVHGACEHGACGACTVLVDGEAVLSCLMFGVQVDGRQVMTVEGLGTEPEHPVQRQLAEHGGLQCGYCTPGMVLAAIGALERNPEMSSDTIERALAGNLCRCTGYTSIVEAVLDAGSDLSGRRP
jgi:aerobic carbon-monoxide dehydrogenase small subunit